MSEITVGLSYAHYPEAAGAGYRGFYEHFESIVWTDIVKKTLQAHGYKVIIAPRGRLKNKVAWLNKANPDIVIEIHFNGSNDPKVSGCETLYCPNSSKGKVLASIVHKEYSPVIQNKDRGVKEGWYKMDRPGIMDYPGDVEGDERPDYFLAKTNCPALILEPEFIARISNITSLRQETATAIALGIIKYFER